jgi:hypothetical protein
MSSSRVSANGRNELQDIADCQSNDVYANLDVPFSTRLAAPQVEVLPELVKRVVASVQQATHALPPMTEEETILAEARRHDSFGQWVAGMPQSAFADLVRRMPPDVQALISCSLADLSIDRLCSLGYRPTSARQ